MSGFWRFDFGGLLTLSIMTIIVTIWTSLFSYIFEHMRDTLHLVKASMCVIGKETGLIKIDFIGKHRSLKIMFLSLKLYEKTKIAEILENQENIKETHTLLFINILIERNPGKNIPP